MDSNKNDQHIDTSTTRAALGVFDVKGDVRRAIELAIGADRIVTFPSAGEGANPQSYLEGKEAFFRKVSDVAIVVDSIEATSVALSSIRHLLAGTLHGVIVTGPIDLAPLRQMALPEEREQLGEAQERGRFIAIQDANPEAVAEHIAEMIDR